MSETLETPGAAESLPGDDLDSILSSAYDAAEAATPSDGPVRDERGRFTSTSAPDGSAADDTDTTDQPEAKADETAEAPSIEPPQSWSDAEKAHWSTLTPAAQETILRRERDVEKAFADRANEQRELTTFKEVLTPYQAKHAMMGLSPQEAVRRLLAAEDLLSRDPDKAFPELMRAYGYDPRRLGLQVPQQGVQQPSQAMDPRVDHLLAELQQQKTEQTLATIESFAKDPAHPHFEDVRQDMGALIAANPQMSLSKAYQIAAAANPAVSAKLRAAEQQAQADKARKEAADKTAAARRAGVGVRDNASGAGAQARGAAKTLEEELERAWGG